MSKFFAMTALLAALVTASPAMAADLAAAKAMVDSAKAQGLVGEQSDGMLGIVSGADGALSAAVSQINAGRVDAYRGIAAKTGTTPDAAGQATASQLIAKLPAGQYYKPVGGGWTKK